MATQETPKTALTVLREDAQNQISAQIENAVSLLQTPIKSSGELTSTQNTFYRWRDYNKELLRQIFNTYQVVNQFIPQGFSIGFFRENLHLSVLPTNRRARQPGSKSNR